MVFAADSAATLTLAETDGIQTVLNVYNNADKVFNLHRDLPLVAMTCGMGHIGGRSISNLAKELRFQLSNGEYSLDDKAYSISDVVGRCSDFLKEKYAAVHPQPQHGHYLEFFVGGYGADNAHGEIWKIVVIDGTFCEPQQLVKADDTHGLHWGGQGSAIARLVLGIDPAFSSVLEAEGVPRATSDVLFEKARAGLETAVMHPTMPIIDAIRLAEFLVDTTKNYFSFKFGSDIVGGATDVATVTKWEGFKWIKRKHYYSDHLNPRDHGHVC